MNTMTKEEKKLYDYPLRTAIKKPMDILIFDYKYNPLIHPPFMNSGKYSATFLTAKKLEEKGVVQITINETTDRAKIKPIIP